MNQQEAMAILATLATKPLSEWPKHLQISMCRTNPEKIFKAAGMEPDQWQEEVMQTSTQRTLMCCSRQSGKSLTAAALALQMALFRPKSLVLLLSPSQRQSGELFRAKVLHLYNASGRMVPTVQQSALTMELENGSRIISLPGDEETIRGYSGVNLLIVDEASRVPDELYRAVRPMLAVSHGRLVCLSTPWGKRGWFYEEWTGANDWKRVEIKAEQCPRISREFLEEERTSLGERWYRQEYECSYEETIDAVFAEADIVAAMDDEVEPLFAPSRLRAFP